MAIHSNAVLGTVVCGVFSTLMEIRFAELLRILVLALPTAKAHR